MAIDPRSLAGGHATGNLSEDERRLLYEAALEDQDLFDTLIGEESFRELLEDPVVVRRLQTVLAEDEPRARQWTWGWFVSSNWLPASAALVLVAALIPLVSTLLEDRRPEPGDDVQVAVSPPADPGERPGLPSAADWAAAVERVPTDGRRLSFRTAVPKEFEPLRRGGTSLHVVPDRSGRAMVIGVDRAGRAERVYPPGGDEWAEVDADVPVNVTLPDEATRFVEYRLVIVDRGEDVRDLAARLDEGRAVVYRVRPN